MLKRQEKHEQKLTERGITLVALVVTIIVLLILAGVSVGILFGDSGLINQAINAKEQAEIDSEKEVINISAISVLGRNTYDGITKENLQKELNMQAGSEKTKAIKDDEDLYVKFIESDRYYKVGEDGEIEGPVDVDIAKDVNPGDITTDSEGNTLAGTEDNPYQINCIEDLCGFSNSVNSGTSYSQKYIILTRNLNFKSYFSYVNGNISVSGDIKSCNTIEELIDLLTNINNEGFIPIGNSGNAFSGNFNGQNHKIENIYENTTDKLVGLFGNLHGNAEANPTTVKNLIVAGKIIASNNAGGIVGECAIGYMNFENIFNYINISTTYGNAGCLIGLSQGNERMTINKCHNYGIITNTSPVEGMKQSTGGLIGFCYGGTYTITNCVNYGEISGKDTYAYDGTGGIIGGTFYPTITLYNTCNYGDISGGQRTGGIIGEYTNSNAFEMANVFNTGKTISTVGWTTGGLVGATRDLTADASMLLNCYYISTTAKGVGAWSIQAGTQYTEEQLKSEDFVNTLNGYTESNTDGIDTTGWSQWKYNENEYPTLQ